MTKKRKVYVPCEHGRLEPHTVTPTIDEQAAAACGNCDCDWCNEARTRDKCDKGCMICDPIPDCDCDWCGREPEPYLCTPTSHYEYQQTISETASYGTTWWTTTPLDWMATTCADCPVRTACGQWAMSQNVPLGVFGGLAPRERQRQIRDGWKETG